jgi:hypothetical protein
MTSYTKIINEYLNIAEINSLSSDYASAEKNINTRTFDDKNVIISNFYNSDLQHILALYIFIKMFIRIHCSMIIYFFYNHIHLIDYS